MAVTVFSGQTHDVNDTSETSDVVLSGGTLETVGGATLDIPTVFGTENINNLGFVASSYVEGVAFTGGTGSVFINGGDENVLAGGSSYSTVVTGVSSGGSAFFGIQEIYGTADSTVAIDLGIDVVYDGGSALGTTVSSGGNEFVESGGYASSTGVYGGVQAVESGGFATATLVYSGHLLIASDGSAVDVIVDGGDELIAGYGSSAVISSGGLEVIEAGGSSYGDTLNGGVQVVFGSAAGSVVESYGEATSTTVNGGGTQVLWGSGAYSSWTTVNSGSFDFVVYGGFAEATFIHPGGTEYVEYGGSTSQDSVSGTVVVSSAHVFGDYVAGELVLDSLGSAHDVYVSSGGTMFLKSGAVGSNTSVAGQEYLYGGRAYYGHISSGGTEYVGSGGSAIYTVIVSAGTQVVDSGGFAASAFVGGVTDGGKQIVSSGGEAYAASMYSGGLEQVLSGGSALSTYVYSGGTMELESGGYVGSAPITFADSHGTLQLDDSVNFSGRIAGFDAFAGSGSASEATNYLDLRDILYGPTTNLSFTEAGNNESGTLTVTDGTHTANLVLLGDYAIGDFSKTSDGFGGTEIYDPANSAQGSAIVPTHT
jgi:autotransporter passenger strand-loop-strand repeat protein